MGIQARNPNEEEEEVDQDLAGEPVEPVVDFDDAVDGVLLTAVDHIGVVVEDLDEAIAAHRDTFGVLVSHREEWFAEDATVAFLGVGPSTIQLIAPLSDESEYAEFLAEGGPGLHHVGYRVADIDAALDALRRAGRELLDDEARPGPAGTRVAFVHPDVTYGVLVQLVQR